MSSSNRKPRPLSEAYLAMLKTTSGGALGESRQRLFAIKKAAEHGDFPKEQTMREHLKRGGWIQVAPELWTKPS